MTYFKAKMKANVLWKFSARNSRMPIDLFRSLEYRIRLQKKQAVPSIKPSTGTWTASATTTSLSSSSSSGTSPRFGTSLSLPQRGAFVQLDTHTFMRPKSKLLNRTKQQQHRARQHKLRVTGILRQAEQRQHDQDTQIAQSGDLRKDENVKDEKDIVAIHPIVIGPSQNLVIMNAVDLKSLELLEDKVIILITVFGLINKLIY